MVTIREAAATGEREFLEALRDHLASVLDGTPPPHTIAGLTKQLMEVRRELGALDVLDGKDDLGDAAATPDEPLDPDAV